MQHMPNTFIQVVLHFAQRADLHYDLQWQCWDAELRASRGKRSQYTPLTERGRCAVAQYKQV